MPKKNFKIKLLGTNGKIFNENSSLLGLQIELCFNGFNFAWTAIEPRSFQKVQPSQKISSFKISTLIWLWDYPRYISSLRLLREIKCNTINFANMISIRDILQDNSKNGWKTEHKPLGLKLKFSGVIKEMIFIQYFGVRNKAYSFLIQSCQQRFIKLI